MPAPGYQGPRSAHFDGERFHNVPEVPRRTVGDLLRWRLIKNQGPWTEHDDPPGPPPVPHVGPGELRVTLVNHATVLIQLDGVNLLTDPIWSNLPSPVPFVGPGRFRPPGLRLQDLPPIDAVLISHNHYDHLDLPTLRALVQAHHPRIIAGLGTRALLQGQGIDGAWDVDWWHTIPLAHDVRVTSTPCQHVSRRALGDDDNTLWTSFVIEGRGGPVYFSGDTGFGPHFAATFERFGPMRLALLAIGAYEPRWFMAPMHMAPDEAVQAARVLHAQTAMAVHFGTFALGDDGMDEGPALVARTVAQTPLQGGEFLVPQFGQAVEIRALGP